MKKMKLKKSFFKYNKLKFLILIFILLFLCLIFVFRYINLKISPNLLNIAELEARKIASIIVNDAVRTSITENMEIDELFLITRDNNYEIKTIDFNPITVNKILTKITNSVQSNLQYIEQGKVELLNLTEKDLVDYDINKLKQGIIYEIPSGVILGNSFLANLGPKIPVKISLIGDIVSYINTEVTDYGINNALIEVNIVLEVTEQVILPFTSDKITINTSIPVALKLVQGSIPNYYLNGISQNSSSFALPIE